MSRMQMGRALLRVHLLFLLKFFNVFHRFYRCKKRIRFGSLNVDAFAKFRQSELFWIPFGTRTRRAEVGCCGHFGGMQVCCDANFCRTRTRQPLPKLHARQYRRNSCVSMQGDQKAINTVHDGIVWSGEGSENRGSVLLGLAVRI